jgi:hypothetical protein
VVAWTAARGIGQVRARSNSVRAEAHAFYRGLGFEELKTQAVFVRKV